MIETSRLILKEYDEKYALQAHLNFFSSKETAKYVLWRPTESAQEVIDKVNYWLNVAKIDIFWVIHEKDDDEPIGFVAASKLEDSIYGDVGIAIGESFVGKGYGSEVLKALIEQVKSLGGKELHYSHFKENEASRKLALKFGFEYYKSDKRLRRYDNKEFEELFYVLKLDL